MSHSKLVSYIISPRAPLKGNRTIAPVILSDSKDLSLKHHTINHPVDQSIEWCCVIGSKTYDRVIWLCENIEQLISTLGNIHLYVWSGTNDLTSIDKSTIYISLTNQNNDTIDELRTYYQLVAEMLNIFPASKLTILEIPPYSIERWNSLKHHKHPENFREQDHDLWDQIDKLNNLIRYMNSSLGSHSPNLSLTLYKNPK